MKPKWIVENFVGENGYEDLIAEIKKQGMECEVLDIRNHFELKPGIVKPNECIVFQGSIQLFRKLKKELGEMGCYPIGWMNDFNYQYSTYYPKLKEFLFNDKHNIMMVRELKVLKWEEYGLFAKEGMIFIRPNSGDKLFTGQLLDLQDFDKFWDTTKNAATDDDLVVTSSPKTIKGEWRYVCHGVGIGAIIASSTYQYQGKRTICPGAPAKATDLCIKVLDKMDELSWFPDPVFTVDICEDADGNFWLLELNSFTSAGTYAADKSRIVTTVSKIAGREYDNKVRTGCKPKDGSNLVKTTS